MTRSSPRRSDIGPMQAASVLRARRGGTERGKAQAMRPGFEVVEHKAHRRRRAGGGEPVRVLPGNYTVRLAGRKNGTERPRAREGKTAVKF